MIAGKSEFPQRDNASSMSYRLGVRCDPEEFETAVFPPPSSLRPQNTHINDNLHKPHQSSCTLLVSLPLSLSFRVVLQRTVVVLHPGGSLSSGGVVVFERGFGGGVGVASAGAR